MNAHFLGHAVVAKTVADVNRGKGQRAYKVEDFVPKFEEEEQGLDQLLQFAQMMTITMGGEDKRDA